VIPVCLLSEPAVRVLVFTLPLTAAANAYVEDPVLVAAYVTDRGVREREWVTRYQPPEHPIPPNTRVIAASAAEAMVNATERHPARRRLGRVLAFYRESLRHAQTASVLLAVEYLQVAAETLTPLMLDQVCGELAIEKEELAQRRGIDPSDDRNKLLRSIRLHDIYDGDRDLRQAVEKVSNGFEHGFEELDRAREVAAHVVLRASDCIRRGILRVAGLSPEQSRALNDPSFSVPMPLFHNEYLYVGTLTVTDEKALAPGTSPVEGLRQWTPRIVSTNRESDGRLRVVTEGGASGPKAGVSVKLKTLVQRLPAGLPAGARVPEHRFTDVEVVDEDVDSSERQAT
jgi:hypothetical protein